MLVPQDKLKSAVDKFVAHFSQELDQVEAISGPSARTFRKALAVSLLDALSISTSSPRQSPRQYNRERFTNFVRTFSDWPDGKRVSLPHLVQLLRRNPDPAFEVVRRKATDMLTSWTPMHGTVVSIAEDPLPSVFETDWPRKPDMRAPLEGVTLERLTHYDLFYAYRNGLVHELRQPGYGFGSGHYDFPHYHELTTFSYGDRDTPGTETIELVYPDVFILNLCRTAIVNLRDYLIRNKLNPYESYRFGTYWISELNN